METIEITNFTDLPFGENINQAAAIAPVENGIEYEILSDDIIYDIGEETLKKYEEIINNSKTIFINGTVGLYEDERFKFGTVELFNILKSSNSKTYVGGGDAVSAANKLGFNNDFYFKSTGGGATLEYIINKKMISLEEHNDNN